MLRLTDYDAILSDLDGVLADSTAAIRVIYDAWADRRGLDREAVRAAYPGTPAPQVVAEVAPHLDPQEESAALLEDELRAEDDVHALPGAAELLAAPPVPLAVVTSCPRVLAERRFETTGLTVPPVVVCADDVERGKPDPAPYLLAAERLGVDAARCLVIEDAPAGVAAGKAAGATVLGLLTTHTAQQLAAADVKRRDLEDLGWRGEYR